ncbi:MAG TPA: hypothetical protein VL086_14230 [Candidatus Nitrosotalea sp.]|jgi:hypothetical protein|nr:hypothetical protein [Candidatus Nitrosotalea sp.]
MKKVALGLLLVLGVLAISASPGYTGGSWHGSVVIGVGPYWGYPGWGYPYWGYPPPYYYYPPPTVVIEQPPVYVEREPAPVEAPPAPPAPPAASTAYWYYCPSTRAYYPSVPTCSEEWVKVPERPR